MSSHLLRTKESGFTLVEAIIYIALFVLLSVLLVDSLVAISRVNNEAKINRDLLDSANVAVERMTREIRGATTVVLGGSVLNTSPGTITLKNPDNSTEIFQLASSTLLFTDKYGNSSSLTGNEVSVNSLVFRNISTGHGGAVKIEMTLNSLRFASHRTISISDTVVMRGAYN